MTVVPDEATGTRGQTTWFIQGEKDPLPRHRSVLGSHLSQYSGVWAPSFILHCSCQLIPVEGIVALHYTKPNFFQ